MPVPIKRRCGSKNDCADITAGSRSTVPSELRQKLPLMLQAMSSRRRDTTMSGGRRFHTGHHCRIKDDVETALGQRGGDGTRHDRGACRGVSSRRAWWNKRCLSPARRTFRLDRSGGFFFAECPLTRLRTVPMVRRLYARSRNVGTGCREHHAFEIGAGKSFFPQVPFMRLNDLIAPNAIL